MHLQKTRLIKTIRFNVLREEPRRETLALEEVVDGGCGRERMEKEKKQSEERHGCQRHCHRLTDSQNHRADVGVCFRSRFFKSEFNLSFFFFFFFFFEVNLS